MAKQRSTNVLVVEDEFLVSVAISDALAEHGFAVRTASNARDALRMLAEGDVDVLFTDINLPGEMDGISLARQARELTPDLPVLYASAVTSLEPSRTVPGSIFIPKPYDPIKVCSLIGRLAATAH